MDYSEIEMRGDNDPLADAIEQAQSMFEDFGRSVSKIFESITGVSSFDDLWDKIKRGAAAFQATELGIKQLNKSLNDTSYTAGLSRKALEDMNEQLQKISNYGEDAIRSAETALLKFKNVKGVDGIFQNTLKAAMDLAAGIGTDLVGAVNLLGAALNNPRKGLFDLEEAGVQFTKSQKALIEGLLRLGDVTRAQQIILDAVAKSYGGWGDKSNDVAARLDKLNDSTNKIWKTVGEFLVPWINKAIDVLETIDVVVKTLAQDFLKSFGPGTGMQGIVDTAFKEITKWFWKFVDGATQAFTFTQMLIESWSEVSKQAFGIVGIAVIDALQVALAYVVDWGGRLLESLRPALKAMEAMWDFAKAYVASWAQYSVNVVAVVADQIVGVWNQLVAQAKVIWDQIGQPIVDWGFAAVGAFYLASAVATTFFNIVVNDAKIAWDILSAGPKILLEVVTGAFKGMWEVAKIFFEGLALQAKTTLALLALPFASLYDLTKGYFDAMFKIVEGWVQGVITALESLTGPFSGIFETLRQLGVDVVTTALDPMNDAIHMAKIKMIDLKIAMKGLNAPDVKMPDFKIPAADLGDMNKALQDAKDALAAMAGGDALAGFDDNLEKNREALKEFIDRVQKIVDDNKYKTVFGDQKPGGYKGLGLEGGREVGDTAGRIEDLISLNRRIQEAAAKPPELAELERQTRIMEEEREVQKQIRDHLRQVHPRDSGIAYNVPGFNMMDLVTPQGLGT